jgi:shikimate dehydrogenase
MTEHRPTGHWPSARTTVVGVMGDPIAHSLSPVLFNTAFAELGLDWVALGFPVPMGSAGPALDGMRALDIAGLSVTMPHKSDVVPLVDELSDLARRLGAVNTIANRSGHLVGDNTDGAGFLASLVRSADFDVTGKRCLVLGAGGAARAVVAALGAAQAAEIVVVNRTVARGEQAARLGGAVARVGVVDEAAGMDLIVNATPLGMDGTETEALGPSALGQAGQVAVDLIYHPLETEWLRQSSANGATAISGLGMLVHQAAAQFTLWTGQIAPTEAMWQAAEFALGTR